LQRYEGYRLFAVDGSIVTLEDTLALRGEFGVSGEENGVASGRLSTMTDVLNSGIIMDAQFTKYSIGERESAIRHHEKLQALGIEDETIMLYDRGYISEQMVSDLNSKHIHYVFRVPKGWNKTVDSLEVGTDAVIEIKVHKTVLSVRIVKFSGKFSLPFSGKFCLPNRGKIILPRTIKDHYTYLSLEQKRKVFRVLLIRIYQICFQKSNEKATYVRRLFKIYLSLGLLIS